MALTLPHVINLMNMLYIYIYIYDVFQAGSVNLATLLRAPTRLSVAKESLPSRRRKHPALKNKRETRVGNTSDAKSKPSAIEPAHLLLLQVPETREATSYPCPRFRISFAASLVSLETSFQAAPGQHRAMKAAQLAGKAAAEQLQSAVLVCRCGYHEVWHQGSSAMDSEDLQVPASPLSPVRRCFEAPRPHTSPGRPRPLEALVEKGRLRRTGSTILVPKAT